MGDNFCVSNFTYKEITKSEQDSRLYRACRLSNSLEVMLISDSVTEKSAAAIDVNVGSLSDPDEVPGLAHFLEHMLFLGTEKFPLENEYTKYLSEFGGCSNACTEADHTRFFFDVLPDHLSGALERFSQFFVAPLFTESATSRELKAVHLEHEKNLVSDVWRFNQLERFISKEGHPYRKFSTGNKKTLEDDPKEKGIDIRQELLNFHSKWYSANIMRLVVLGRESLDELEAMVSPLFSQIVNKNVEPPLWLDHPVGPEQMKLQAFVVPIHDIRSISITFPIPDYHAHYKSAPGHYVSHLIGHEGKGSLLSALRNRGWCNQMTAGFVTPAKGFSTYNIEADLTIEGLKNVNNVVTLVFQYLNMLKKLKPQEWIFKECNQINRIGFRFKDKESPYGYVSSIASRMHRYPSEEVLVGPYSMTEWQPDLIEEYLELLVPSRVRVAVASQDFQTIADSEEFWYGTKYKLDHIDEEVLEKWKTCGLCSDMECPKPNIFIPENFEIFPCDEQAPKPPALIHNSDLSKLWFKQDDTFHLPKAVVKLDVFSPLGHLDPFNGNLLFMFATMLKDCLNEYSYEASLAGLHWEVNNTKHGVELAVGGYNDKLHLLFDKVLDRMTNLKVDEKRFELLKETYVRSLQNFEKKHPYQQAIYYLSSLLTEQCWTCEQLLSVIDQVTPQALSDFIPCFLHRVHIEGLVYGNINKERALAYIHSVEEKVGTNGAVLTLMPQQLLRNREIQLDGTHYVYETHNKVHVTSSAETYFQCGVRTTQSNMELELLSKILNEPCFDILRTKEQLGYLVWSGCRRSSGVQGFRIILESDRHPEFLLQRIEAFLSYARQLLCDLTDEQFEKQREALAALRLEKPKNLNEQFSRYWIEISTQQYHFARAEVEVAYLRTITLEQVIDFFDKYIAVGAPNRNQLSVYVVSAVRSSDGSFSNDDIDKAADDEVPKLTLPTPIEDVTTFKRSHGLFPLAQTYIDFNQTKSKL